MSERIIAIGSLNQTKIKAVETVFPYDEVHPIDAPSGVANQPFGDMETKQGAEHRATYAREDAKASTGIGLEGGVILVGEKLYLCNWGAIVDIEGNKYTASGARIELPQAFKRELESGTELSVLMDAYTKRTGIRHHEGAIGIFTNKPITRADMFTHVVHLLKGQFDYWERHTDKKK